MHMLWKYVPQAAIWRVQHAAYLRWCKTGVGELALDARLTRKLTKRRKLSWRAERRHMRHLLRVEALGTALRGARAVRSPASGRP